MNQDNDNQCTVSGCPPEVDAWNERRQSEDDYILRKQVAALQSQVQQLRAEVERITKLNNSLERRLRDGNEPGQGN